MRTVEPPRILVKKPKNTITLSDAATAKNAGTRPDAAKEKRPRQSLMSWVSSIMGTFINGYFVILLIVTYVG